MECPHCHQGIQDRICAFCKAAIPMAGSYCMECGAKLNSNGGKANPIGEEDGFEFENRTLCSDGTCTGIIVDGSCTECGKPLKEAL